MGQQLNEDAIHDKKIEKELYAELREFGFRFHSQKQFHYKTFKKEDSCVIPIITRYLYKFCSENNKIQYISSLGVKGFYDATDYLIREYKSNLPPSYNQIALNCISQTLARICDLRYLDSYFELLSNNVTMEAGYLIQMLERMKVQESIPYLIKLVDQVAIIPQEWVGNQILEEHKYYVSQCAIKAIGSFENPNYAPVIKRFLKPETIEWIHLTQGLSMKALYSEYRDLTQKALNKMQV